MVVIVLDPGHGGARLDARPGIDRGASAGGVNESDLALVYASELACALAARGLAAWMTRMGESLPLTLAERARLANEKRGAEVFVSLHCNASPRPDAEGFQVFHCRGSAAGERLARSIFAAVVPAVAGATARAGVHPDQSAHCGYTRSAELYIDTLRAGQSWAALDTAVRSRYGSFGGYRRLLVLRQTRMPAVLVELDYLTCEAARERLTDDGYRSRLCRAMAAGIYDSLEN